MNNETSWVLIQYLKKQFPGFWKMGLISLYLILKSLNTLKFRNSALKKLQLLLLWLLWLVMQMKDTTLIHWYFESPFQCLNEEFYLQTQAGDLKYCRRHSAVNTARGIKNPGHNEVLSTQPFYKVYKHARATLTPENTSRRRCLQMALPLSGGSSRSMARSRSKSQHSRGWPFPSMKNNITQYIVTIPKINTDRMHLKFNFVNVHVHPGNEI